MDKNPKICVIVATDCKGGFSKNGEIVWKIPEDFKHFREITTKGETTNSVIMGRTTFETTGVLKNRCNIVLSNNPSKNIKESTGFYTCKSLTEAIKLSVEKKCETIFIIGGELIYNEAIKTLDIECIYRTYIDYDFNCDRFFPDLTETEYKCVEKKYGGKYENANYWFEIWKKSEKYKKKK